MAAATGSLRATTTTTATAAAPETISADPRALLPDGKFPFVRPVCPVCSAGRWLNPSFEIRRWHFFHPSRFENGIFSILRDSEVAFFPSFEIRRWHFFHPSRFGGGISSILRDSEVAFFPSFEIRRWHFFDRFVPRRKGHRDKSLLPDENKFKCCSLDVCPCHFCVRSIAVCLQVICLLVWCWGRAAFFRSVTCLPSTLPTPDWVRAFRCPSQSMSSLRGRIPPHSRRSITTCRTVGITYVD